MFYVKTKRHFHKYCCDLSTSFLSSFICILDIVCFYSRIFYYGELISYFMHLFVCFCIQCLNKQMDIHLFIFWKKRCDLICTKAVHLCLICSVSFFCLGISNSLHSLSHRMITKNYFMENLNNDMPYNATNYLCKSVLPLVDISILLLAIVNIETTNGKFMYAQI